MKIQIYKGLTESATLVFERDIFQYVLGDNQLRCMLKGGYPTLGVKYNDLTTVKITESVQGDMDFKARFLSNNFVVADDRKTGATGDVIADNTLLFELLEV